MATTATVDTATFLAHVSHADRAKADDRCQVCRDHGPVRMTAAEFAAQYPDRLAEDRHAFPYAVQVLDLSGFTAERYATQDEAMAVAKDVVAQGRAQAIVSVTVSGTLAARYVARWFDGERVA